MKLLSDIISFRNPKFTKAFLIWLVATLATFPIVMASGTLLPIFFLVLGVGLLITDQKFPLLVLYIIYLPTNGMIPRSDFLGGAIGIQQVLSLCALVAILRIRITNKPDQYKNLAAGLLVLLLGYLLYTSFKNAYFDMHGTHWIDSMKRLINVSILYLPILLMIRKMGNSTVQQWGQIGVFLGAVNMAIFCFASPLLPDLGFYSLGTETVGIALDADEYNRFTGIIGDGDSNTLGAFFVIACGFYLSQPLGLRRSNLIKAVVILSAIGVALTASRTALVSLFLVGALFFTSRGGSKIKLQILVGILFLFIAAAPLWETVFTRMLESGGDQLRTDSSGNRIGKWILYFQHFINHPRTFLFGADVPLFVGFKGRYLVAHNFYIQIIYNSGVAFLIGFIWFYGKIFRLMMKGNSAFRLDLILIPLIAVTFFVSDVGAFIFFIIYLSMNYAGSENDSISQSN